jgi:hypothetical protein
MIDTSLRGRFAFAPPDPPTSTVATLTTVGLGDDAHGGDCQATSDLDR